jgi:hypothetical protein
MLQKYAINGFKFRACRAFLYKKRPDGLWPKIQPIRARAFCLFSKSPSPIFGLGLEPNPALKYTFACSVLLIAVPPEVHCIIGDEG